MTKPHWNDIVELLARRCARPATASDRVRRHEPVARVDRNGAPVRRRAEYVDRHRRDGRARQAVGHDGRRRRAARAARRRPDEDHRTIFRVIRGHGVRNGGAIPCPDDTGSHLVVRRRPALRQPMVQHSASSRSTSAARPGRSSRCRTDLRSHDRRRLLLLRDDRRRTDRAVLPHPRRRARSRRRWRSISPSIPFHARGLAFDGERFWTNDREVHQTVAFAQPELNFQIPLCSTASSAARSAAGVPS